MWLPKPIYEHMPQFWLLLGLLFFAFGLYLGFEYDLIYVYLFLGAACLVRSVWVFVIRRSHRDAKPQIDTQGKNKDGVAAS